ncbi:hypothetical protein Z517_06477 [Fonsecaea pedrosoi CBS 271.37]|uniref:Unplaced genomic scaffold supercont1.4, whole genome shotgun sequence n=1 Tax=Fonsecaea pedrosoi CBS 271.37 TaxID=1442368 RepID=A0A0D2EZU5_9EURO|nr:uncharacterized protein Z517_06477 [Fonsecaea pedrosoi CBS 271.37]KIW79862.1 hypothetical protein Z517_06477 [Fonsecaea pedrosoi CBS 271.37]
MAKVRLSNLERRRLREECRELLSKHIESKIGIKVHPSQVRLMPKPSDPYRWKIIPEREDVLSELFSKNISDHSIRAYRDLCEGVDKTFEAVSSAPPNTNALGSVVSLQDPKASFSAKIEHLENESARFFHELCQWRDKATAESKGRQLAEEEANRLHETNQQLQGRIREYSDRANYLTGQAMKCFEGLDKVLLVLEELRSGLTLGVSFGSTTSRRGEMPCVLK